MTAVAPAPVRPYLFDARSAGWSRTTGWERYTRALADRLAVTDERVEVRIAGSEAPASRLWQDAVAVPLAGRGRRVVHFPTLPPLPWDRLAARVVLTVHDLTWFRHGAVASRLGRHYYARSARRALGRAHLVTGTETVAAELTAEFGIAREDLTVVPLGVDLPPAADVAPRPRPYLLAVGTLEPRKNLLRLAEAYRRSGLAASHDLVLAGRAAWGERPAGVVVLEGLGDAELVALYAGASALVMPSLYEGFGLPVVEALQLGVPVLCSDLPVLREVSGGYATFVDPTDTDALVDGLRAATTLTAPDGAAAWARDRWNWDRSTQALSHLYRSLDAGG